MFQKELYNSCKALFETPCIIPKIVLYMNLESTKPRGRPRNRRQDEMREDGRSS
jgi:hypothetical protein